MKHPRSTAGETHDAALKVSPHGVWIPSFVSLLMDVSSEIIHSLPPMFMATTLGAGGARGRNRTGTPCGGGF